MEKLHIVIPTFNRAEYLVELLNSIYQSQLPINVDVTVIDNCSTDTTPEICSRFPVTYIRNKNNIRGDLNVYSAYKIFEDGYVWVVGDDEIMYHDSTRKVCKLLSKNPSIIIGSEKDEEFDDLITYIITHAGSSHPTALWEHPLIKLSLISNIVIKTGLMDFNIYEENISGINWTRYAWLMGIFKGLLFQKGCLTIPGLIEVRENRAESDRSFLEIQGQFEDQLKFLNWIYTKIIPRESSELCSVQKIYGNDEGT